MKSNVTKLKPVRTLGHPVPPHLDAAERALWTKITADYVFDDAGLAILEEGLSALRRARRCREAVDKDGEAVPDRWGQLKPHPLLMAERDSRTQFLSAMRALHLDVPGDAKP